MDNLTEVKDRKAFEIGYNHGWCAPTYPIATYHQKQYDSDLAFRESYEAGFNAGKNRESLYK